MHTQRTRGGDESSSDGACSSSSGSFPALHRHLGPCPIRSITLHVDGGGREDLDVPASLVWLQPGQRLFDSGPALLSTPLHPSFPSDCWCLPGLTRHWSNDLDDYVTLRFSGGATRVYVLLPSFINDPR